MSGADHDGDVLVILGTTLIVWAVIPEWIERPGLWTIPHTAPEKILIGGPSNAGGLFINWALGLLGDAGGSTSIPPGCRCGPRTCEANGSRTTTPTAGEDSGTSI